jgi:Fe-S cluster assembly protein SufD
MTAVSEQIGSWLDQFTKQPSSPFQGLRQLGFARFTELGFPTTRDEDWRFTNVAPIARGAFARAEASEVDVAKLAPWATTNRLVFVNGILWHRPPGLCAGVQAGNLTPDAEQYLAKQAQLGDNPFVALNTAFLNEGAYVRVARGTVVEEPIHIVYVTDAQAGRPVPHTQPRGLFIIGPEAQCSIVETYVGTGAYFTNAVTEIVASDSAVVDHYKVTVEAPEAFHIATLHATLGRSTNFISHSISLGGALIRNDAGATLSQGTEATLNGLYIVNGTQHVDNHTSIDHAKPHAVSHELYKGILDGKAGAVFNGRIIVRKDAQKTDSKQTNKNLVLSDEAVINTKPELQIFADDVRCTHGATIGQLDAESMFYLQSRGISRGDARSLLTYAFAKDIIDRVKVSALRDSLERVLFEKFHEHAE